MDYQQLAWECEAILKNGDDNIKAIPKEAIPIEGVMVMNESIREGVPTAMVKHPKHGYVVICKSGQGPYVIWIERES